MRDITVEVGNRPFVFPENLLGCVTGVLKGEYMYPELPDALAVGRVLDLGANVGAFARWAQMKWPAARITCYEPHPGCLSYLRRNEPGVTIVEKAVCEKKNMTRGNLLELYEGSDWGMNSSDPKIGRRLEKGEAIWYVDAVEPSGLPGCDVLKVDTEGHEVAILESYKGRRVEDKPHTVLFEWHRETDREQCESACLDLGLRMIRSSGALSWGVQAWVTTRCEWSSKAGTYVLPEREKSRG